MRTERVTFEVRQPEDTASEALAGYIRRHGRAVRRDAHRLVGVCAWHLEPVVLTIETSDGLGPGTTIVAVRAAAKRGMTDMRALDHVVADLREALEVEG
jgi:hypothetical protein